MPVPPMRTRYRGYDILVTASGRTIVSVGSTAVQVAISLVEAAAFVDRCLGGV